MDRKKRKVFVTAHVVLRTDAMFLASALTEEVTPREYEKRQLIPGGDTSV